MLKIFNYLLPNHVYFFKIVLEICKILTNLFFFKLYLNLWINLRTLNKNIVALTLQSNRVYLKFITIQYITLYIYNNIYLKQSDKNDIKTNIIYKVTIWRISKNSSNRWFFSRKNKYLITLCNIIISNGTYYNHRNRF
jgi:hypothetical protein